jgi:pyroglutamyl-peptidase
MAHEEVEEALVLVTGFGPFPGQPVNPTESIVDAMAGLDHVVAHVLATSYRLAVEQLDDLVAMVDPAAVVAFGVAADATGIRLEEVARARVGARVDVEGRTSGGPAAGEPVRSRLPLGDLADALVAAGLPVQPSDDAGDYVCNHLFHHLVTAPALAERPVGFVHVPDPGRDGPLGQAHLGQAQLVLAANVIVDTVAAHARGDL